MRNEHWQAFAPNLATSASYRRCSILSRRIHLTDLVDVSLIATQHRKGLPSPKYPVTAHYDLEDADFASKGAGVKLAEGVVYADMSPNYNAQRLWTNNTMEDMLKYGRGRHDSIACDDDGRPLKRTLLVSRFPQAG